MGRMLVTSGDGFIGAPLTQALRRRHEVIALTRADGDISEAATLEALQPTDHVFHLAARTFVPDSWHDPAGFIDVNVVGTTNVLEYCRRASAGLTYVSAYVYGPPLRVPIPEDDTPVPNNPYALSKYLAEQVCAFYARHRGVRVTIVRPFNVYGPNQPGQFLIPQIVRQVKEGRRIEVMDLTPRRDYVYVDDVVDLLLRTIGRDGDPLVVVNAGSGTSVTVQELIETVQGIAGTDLPIVSAEIRRIEELADVRADIRGAQRHFGWSPRTSLRTGLARIVEEQHASP